MSEPYWTPLGAMAVDYEGTFNPATQYVPGDVVRYQGVDYLCVNPALGQVPPVAAGNPVIDARLPLDRLGIVSPPNPLTDEFQGAGIDAKWLALGQAFAVIDANQTALDALYMAVPTTQSLLGIRYQAMPAFPFSAAFKLVNSAGGHVNNRMGGIVLLPAAPTTASPCIYCGFTGNAALQAQTIRYTSLSAFGANVSSTPTGVSPLSPTWYRLSLGGATGPLNCDFSFDGFRWRSLTSAYTIPFAVANIGLAISSESGGTVEAIFDYFRVVPT